MKSIKVFILVISPFMFFTACGTPEVSEQDTMVSSPYDAPELSNDSKQAYLNALNKARSKGRRCGREGYFPPAPALKWSDALYNASYEHSNDMAKSNSFSHMGSSTKYDWTANVQHLGRASSFKERIENNGYTRWKKIAENIALGAATIDDVMVQWLSSDRHCANIMNPAFTDVGMARVKKENFQQNYWTQNFAAVQ